MIVKFLQCVAIVSFLAAFTITPVVILNNLKDFIYKKTENLDLAYLCVLIIYLFLMSICLMLVI
jgi:hypothetical protein